MEPTPNPADSHETYCDILRDIALLGESNVLISIPVRGAAARPGFPEAGPRQAGGARGCGAPPRAPPPPAPAPKAPAIPPRSGDAAFLVSALCGAQDARGQAVWDSDFVGIRPCGIQTLWDSDLVEFRPCRI